MANMRTWGNNKGDLGKGEVHEERKMQGYLTNLFRVIYADCRGKYMDGNDAMISDLLTRKHCIFGG